MKYILVGFGTCGNLWYDAIKNTNNDLLAICDTFAFPKEKNIAYFKDIDELIKANISCDFVIIASSVPTHFPICKKLLCAGYNVIVEKPVSHIFGHILTLTNIAREKGRLMLCAYHSAFGVEVEYFVQNRTILQEGLGKFISFECEFYDPYVENGLLSNKASSLYGSYLDSASNAISVLSRIIDIEKLRNSTPIKPLISESNVYSNVEYTGANISGVIRTDWRKSVNYKATKLIYECGEILLNHSEQCIVKTANGHAETFYPDAKNSARLLNQYSVMLEYIGRKELNIFNEKPYTLLFGKN